MKSGYKTSEFWLMLFAIGGLLAGVLEDKLPSWGNVLAVVSAMLGAGYYALQRTKLKHGSADGKLQNQLAGLLADAAGAAADGAGLAELRTRGTGTGGAAGAGGRLPDDPAVAARGGPAAAGRGPAD